MEDDDEFGDLYTDVLENFPTSSSTQGLHSAPQKSSELLLPPVPPPPLVRRSIDLNLELKENEAYDDDEEYRDADEVGKYEKLGGEAEGGGLEQVRPPGLELDLNNSGRQFGFENGRERESKDFELGNSGERNGRKAGGSAGGNFDEESFRFDLEEDAQAQDQDGDGDMGMGSEPVIPGLSTGPGSGVVGGGGSYGEAGGDDWDSDDSEDDLQIVLNDRSHGLMGRDTGGGEVDDGQDDGMGIGAEDGAGFQHPGVEEQEWGEDGEKKEGGEGARVNPGMIIAPKPGGYGSHGYQPFHSQFKYVRPGATPLQGPPVPGPVGMPGQIRPLVNMGPMAGRGRGEWRPPGMKSMPGMPKGYGGPGWGNNATGRGFGIGLDFTLPSHKTIFEVDIDSFEEKPWNNPGVDITDFFNFGLAEDSWKQYCKQLEQFRVESTMQSKIRVYVSGRSEKEYDPDMPPELAAATGVVETASESLAFRQNDVNHTYTRKDSTPARPPLPVGRAIQVETGSGERLPSIDTRPQRIRDSDAIIEIVCDGFAEGESSEDDAPQPSENDDPSKTEQIENHAWEEAPIETNNIDHSPGKRRRKSPPESPYHSDRSDSRGHTPGHSSGSEDRRKRKLRDESSNYLSPDRSVDDRRDGSSEGINEKTRISVSPGKAKNECQSAVDHMENDDPDLAVAEETLEMDENVQDNTGTVSKNQDDVLPHSKRQKIGSHDSAPSVHDNGEALKAATTSDSSKVRPGNGREYQKTCEIGEQVSQGGRMRNTKRHLVEDDRNTQRRSRDERHEAGKDREDPYAHRDMGLARPSYGKHDSFDKRKERDSSEGVRQRKDEDPHGRKARTDDNRKQDPRQLERGDEMGSKYSGKVWDGDRIDKEDHSYLRKQMDNGKWRGHHDKDVGSRQKEQDDSLKARHENVDDCRRRKNEERQRRDYPEKDDILLGRRESPNLRKRERDDLVDQRRRDDQSRIRESANDHNLVRQKDEVWMQRERSDRLSERVDRERPKQYREGSMSKREREEIRESVRSGRSMEDKRAGHAKDKDEHYDVARFAEPKRRDRVDDVNLIHYRGHEDRPTRGIQTSNHDSKSRKDRPSSHTDHNASSNQKINDEKIKESSRNKESDGRSQNSVSKRAKDEHNSHKTEKAGSKHSTGQGNSPHQIQAHPNSTRKHGEEGVTDDDEQEPSKKGRSKLERWTSHKDRDLTATTKSSASLKAKETIRSSINTESSVPPVASVDKPAKLAEARDPRTSTEEKAPQDSKKDEENKNNDSVQATDQHLDTVAKLKKRSERFKLPMPSEKDTANKKPEAEAPLPQTETPPAEPEVKSERPPRKRRWISST